VPGTSKITVPGKPSVEVPNVTTPSKIIPGAPTTEQPVEIEITRKPNGDAVVTPKKPGGLTYPSGTKVEIPGEDKDGNPITITVTIGDNGSGEVPNDNLPNKDIPGTGTVTEPNKNPSKPVDVTTPARKTPTLEVEQDPKTGDVTVTPKKPDGSIYPPGTVVEIPGKGDKPITVTIGEDGKGKVPNSELPEGKVPGTGKITEPGRPTEEVPNVTTPAHKTPTLDVEQDPKTGDVTVTPKRPDGSTFPPGTTVEIPGENGPITVEIGQDGKGKVPNDKLPKKDVPGTGKITEPGKPAVEVPEVTTPAKVTPTVELEQDPKTGDVTVTPKKPDGSIYPPGTVVEIPGKGDKPITVTIGEDGKGKVPNSELPDGKVTKPGKITEPGKPAVEVPEVTTPAKVTPTVELEQDPKTGDVTVTPKKPDGSIYPPGTVVEIPGKDGKPITVTIGEDGKGKVPNSELPEGKVPGTGKITEPGKPAVEVPVTTPEKLTPTVDVEQDPQTGDVTVTPKKPDGSTYPPGTTVEIPGKDGKPITVTIGEDGKGTVPNSELPEGKVPGTAKIIEPGKPAVEVPNVTTPSKVTPTLDVERDPETGDVTVTPKKPDGSTYPPGTTVEIPGKDGKPITVTIGEDGKGKVPNSDLPDVETPGTGKITEPGKPAVEVPNVTTPAKFTPTTPTTETPGEIEMTRKPNGDAIVTPKKPDGSTYPPGTKVEIPGENGTTITVTIGDNGSGEVPNDKLPKGDLPGKGTVTEPNKKPSQPVDVTTPARKTPTLDVERDPETGDVTVTPKKPDGSTYPPGTTVEIPGKDGKPITVTIGKDGKGKVPNSDLPDVETPGTGKITEPGKPAVEVPNVTTPAKFTPATPVTEQPGKIEITQQPNGNAIVTPKKPDGSTYPSGSKVEIPGENGTTITVTIGDNGSGEVPNDKLPKGDLPGKGTVTEPNKKPSQPVDVTTPARKTPTLDVKRDPETGDVTVTPKKPDGTTYPPGTKVEIPGKDGKPITVTIGEDGKGKVPNSDLPDVETPGTGKITEPGKPAVEVPNVTTPAKFTPTTPTTETPGEIEITRKPNGDAIVTPKKPDGSTYPPGTKVEIPGENGTTITVTIGDNGSGEVPNDKLPKGDLPGKGTVTEPNKKPSQPVDVTTPARKTPTIELDQDPKTGDVTVTPKRPDGSTYPPGTTVEIPGKDGNPIIVTIDKEGKGKVPNSELPDGKVPGTGKITEPGQPAVEVPVETPAKVTPATPTDTNPVAPVTPDTPVKPDTNGGSGQDTPAPATPIPNAVTPNADQVDTKTTVDNGAKSNDSQNVLPNTGTESNAALASLGLLGLLSGFGLVARKKKED
ncbi:LPXTG cell wall anchor domain-containing protein, partial [Streptococcus oralis]